MVTVLSSNVQGGLGTEKRAKILKREILRRNPDLVFLYEMKGIFEPFVELDDYEDVKTTTSHLRQEVDSINLDYIKVMVRKGIKFESRILDIGGDPYGISIDLNDRVIIGIHLYPYDVGTRMRELQNLFHWVAYYQDLGKQVSIVGDWNFAIRSSLVANLLAKKSKRVRDCIDSHQYKLLCELIRQTSMLTFGEGYTFPTGPVRKGWEYDLVSKVLPSWGCLDFLVTHHEYPNLSVVGAPWSDHSALSFEV